MLYLRHIGSLPQVAREAEKGQLPFPLRSKFCVVGKFFSCKQIILVGHAQ